MAWQNGYSRRNKYGNQKASSWDGQRFDSQKERGRFYDLCMLQRAGEIRDLQTQVKFTLIPTQREPGTIGPRGGVKKGKLIEKECFYVADFVYYTKDGEMVVEDTKSEATKTEAYIIKRKLMLWVHGIRIQEI